ncbi:RIP metalloprotease RseP [Candidatus Nomurabacteria bacterium]|nr:RIP metalloprotease RseP [Candidatus Nomurabacteria bacterium]
MFTVIVFVLLLGILVLAHELGHFVSAIRLGVEVEEFGIGFPPKAFSFKHKGIVYSINWIPIGGFVKIKGESGDDLDNPKSFANQKTWKKSVILSAGVLMNFLVAFILLTLGFMIGMPQAIDPNTDTSLIKNQGVVIIEVLENSAADKAGLQIGDRLVQVDGLEINNSEFVYSFIKENNQEELNFVVTRGGEEKKIDAKPEIVEENQEPILGVGMLDVGVVSYGFFGSFWQGAKATGLMTWQILAAFGNLLKDLFTTGHLSQGLSGPVGVAIMTGQVARLGFVYIMNFAAILSINLGVLNILPFPALDGGRLLFVLIEKIRGKKINEKVEAIFHNTGFSLLMLLIIFITWRDVLKYSDQIWQGVKNIF